MLDDLETLYKVLIREQTTGYKDSSTLGGFEGFVSEWCDGILVKSSDTQVQKIVRDIKLMAEDYGTALQDRRERKVAEIGRMLLSLRDVLHQLSTHSESYSYQPDKCDAHKEKEMIYKQEGKFQEAITEFEKAIELSPDDSFALSHLASIYLRQGNFEESRRLIDRSIKINPENPFTHSIKGEILFEEGNIEEAASVFEGVLNLKPDDTYVHGKLGVIYRKQGKLNEALSVLKRGLEFDPENSSLHHALGDVYASSGKDEEAVSEYQKAVEIDPGDDYAFRGLMSSRSRGKDTKTVISQLQKILKIPSRSQNPHLHALLAGYLKQENQYEAAAEEFRESVRLQPHSLYFQIQLAFCYSRLSQFSKVIEILEPVNRIRQNDPIIVQALAKAYAGIERIEDARKLLINILYVYPNDQSLRSALMKIKKPRQTPNEELKTEN